MLTLTLLLALIGEPTKRNLAGEERARCASAEYYVDVRDFGACCGNARCCARDGKADDTACIQRLVNGDDAEAIGYAEQFAKTCIPGRTLPVHYCPAKPST